MEAIKLQLGKPVKHLLVDLDGTLLGNQGFALSVDFLKRSFNIFKKHGGLRDAFSMLFDIHREFDRPSKENTNDIRIVQLVAYRLNLTVEEARLEIRSALMAVFPNLKRHFYPIPGSKEFLEWANGRYPLTLATNPVWPPDIVEMRVSWAGIDPSIFGFITHARLMHAIKPHAEYYLEILEKRGLKGEDCLLVGDDMKKDLPATRVGIRVFIVGSKEGHAPLKTPWPGASAWTGTYSNLRSMLEAQLSPHTSTSTAR